MDALASVGRDLAANAVLLILAAFAITLSLIYMARIDAIILGGINV